MANWNIDLTSVLTILGSMIGAGGVTTMVSMFVNKRKIRAEADKIELSGRLDVGNMGLKYAETFRKDFESMRRDNAKLQENYNALANKYEELVTKYSELQESYHELQQKYSRLEHDYNLIYSEVAILREQVASNTEGRLNAKDIGGHGSGKNVRR